jgi:hypothetical protein
MPNTPQDPRKLAAFGPLSLLMTECKADGPLAHEAFIELMTSVQTAAKAVGLYAELDAKKLGLNVNFRGGAAVARVSYIPSEKMLQAALWESGYQRRTIVLKTIIYSPSQAVFVGTGPGEDQDAAHVVASALRELMRI